MTSVHGGKDVHMLAYFLPPETPGLQPLLAAQRQQRVNRALEISSRLEKLGAPVDTDAMVEAAAGSGKSLARPQIAQALIAAGHVATVAEAFDRYLGEESPAFVPHTGVSPAEVVALVVSGGGIPSLAHPGYRPKDDIIPGLVDAGLVAIEVYHSSHDETATAHYLAMARQHGLLVTGGSDFHGPGTRREEFFGVEPAPADLDALMERKRSADQCRTTRTSAVPPLGLTVGGIAQRAAGAALGRRSTKVRYHCSSISRFQIWRCESRRPEAWSSSIEETASRRKRPRLTVTGSSRMSRAKVSNVERNQRSSGTPKPVFGRSMISAGSSRDAIRRSTYFLVPLRILKCEGSDAANSIRR